MKKVESPSNCEDGDDKDDGENDIDDNNDGVKYKRLEEWIVCSLNLQNYQTS